MVSHACDAAVYGVDVPADRPYLRALFLDFLYSGIVKEQYGSHAADDCHKDDVAREYMLYIHLQCNMISLQLHNAKFSLGGGYLELIPLLAV